MAQDPWQTILRVPWEGGTRTVPLTNWAGRCYPAFPQGDAYLEEVFGLTAEDYVLDVGGGAEPFARADVICEKELMSDVQRAGRALRSDQRYVVAAAEALPFADHSFTFVFSRHVLEHVTDPMAACREMMRVAPRGYIETPSPLSDLLVGDPTHRWFVRVEGETLRFSPRPFVTHPFRNVLRWLLHSDRELYFQWEIAFRNLTSTQFPWEGSFAVVVDPVPPTSRPTIHPSSSPLASASPATALPMDIQAAPTSLPRSRPRLACSRTTLRPKRSHPMPTPCAASRASRRAST